MGTDRDACQGATSKIRSKQLARTHQVVSAAHFILVDDQHEVGDHQGHEKQVLCQQHGHVTPPVAVPLDRDDAFYNLEVSCGWA